MCSIVRGNFSYLKPRALKSAAKEFLRRSGSYAETKAEIHKAHSVSSFAGPSIEVIPEEDTVTKADIAKLLRNSQIIKKSRAFRFMSFRRLASSSGTSGAPLVFPQSIEAIQKEQAYIDYIWERYGFNKNSRVAVMRGEHVPNLYYTTPRRLILCGMSWSEEEILEKAEKIYKFSPEFIHCYSSVFERFIKKVSIAGGPLPDGVSAVLCGSEAINEGQCELFEKILKCDVVGWYGQSEQVALAVREPDGGYAFVPGYSELGFVKRGNVYEICGKSKLNDLFSKEYFRTGDLCGQPYVGWSKVLRFNTILTPKIIGRAEEELLDRKGQSVPFNQIVFGLHTPDWKSIDHYSFVQVGPGKVVFVYSTHSGADVRSVERLLSQVRARISPLATISTCELEGLSNINIKKWRYFFKTPRALCDLLDEESRAVLVEKIHKEFETRA